MNTFFFLLHHLFLVGICVCVYLMVVSHFNNFDSSWYILLYQFVSIIERKEKKKSFFLCSSTYMVRSFLFFTSMVSHWTWTKLLNEMKMFQANKFFFEERKKSNKKTISIILKNNKFSIISLKRIVWVCCVWMYPKNFGKKGKKKHLFSLSSSASLVFEYANKFFFFFCLPSSEWLATASSREFHINFSVVHNS